MNSNPYKELASRVDSCLSISEAEFRNVIPANKKVRKEAAFLYTYVEKEMERRKKICRQLIKRLVSISNRSDTITDDEIETKIKILKGLQRAAQDGLTKLALEKDKRKSALIKLESGIRPTSNIDGKIADAIVKSFSVVSRKL